MSTVIIATILFELLALGACAGKSPETRYYQLAAPTTGPRGGEAVLVLEPLQTDPGYDDERVVYRTTPYRLDYYQYHRWAAAPGTLIGNYLEQALENSGQFRAVTREVTSDAQLVLGGRVVAIEEVDTSKSRWLGRIVIELTLTDPSSNHVLWTEQFEETEPVPQQNPEGLAKALSIAMQRIAAKVAPALGHLASQRSGAPAIGPARQLVGRPGLRPGSIY